MNEPLFLRDILELPERSEKPRKVGRTICGISLGRGKESIEQVALYVDQVKLYVHNTLMPARIVEESIKMYRAMDIDVQMGGVFFEMAAMQGKLDAMVQRAKQIGVNVVEVENHLGAFSLERLKQEVRKLKDEGFGIVGEVGAKWTEDDETRIAQGLCDPDKVIRGMEQLLEAGADEVVWDAYPLRALIGNQLENEAGQNQIRKVAKAIGQERMIFEVSNARGRGKSMQRAWLVHEFGPDVNVGNAHPGDVSELETIRRGIYYDPAWPYIRWLKLGKPTKNWWEIDMPDYDIDIEPRPVWKYAGEESLATPKQAVPVNHKQKN